MYNNKILVTPRIKEELGYAQYLFICELIKYIGVATKDNVQTFILRKSIDDEGLQEIEHIQENPECNKVHKFYTTNPINATIYVVLEKEDSIMLFAGKY